jgi:hypothetical protein
MRKLVKHRKFPEVHVCSVTTVCGLETESTCFQHKINGECQPKYGQDVLESPLAGVLVHQWSALTSQLHRHVAHARQLVNHVLLVLKFILCKRCSTPLAIPSFWRASILPATTKSLRVCTLVRTPVPSNMHARCTSRRLITSCQAI